MNGCDNCILLKPCGGHPLPLVRQLGCVNFANQDKPFDSDDMNPLFPDRFWALWDDVNGLIDYSIGEVNAMKTTGLPRYIPQLQNRTSFRRSRLLDTSVVALRLFDVIGRRSDGTYGPRFTTASALRRAYKLRQDTRILLVGVDKDLPIELFWEEHQVAGIAQAIVDLGIIGVTIPNFSYFTCVPRIQILRNLKRLLLVTERLSKAGIPVAIHLNANTDADWKFWTEFFRAHPECSVLTMEFQTGSRSNGEFGKECYANLVAMQREIGRPIHPIFVGAARFYRDAVNDFASFTVIDSQPFMQALGRQKLVQDSAGRWVWVSSPTPKRAPLDDLIENNMLHYEERLISAPQEDLPLPLSDPNQSELDSITSTPYLTAHPPA